MADSSGFETYLTAEVEEALWKVFPRNRTVSDDMQQEIAQIISHKGDASDKERLANQVVEFLALRRRVPVRNIVEPLKKLYSVRFGRQLCRRQAALQAHPSSGRELVSVG